MFSLTILEIILIAAVAVLWFAGVQLSLFSWAFYHGRKASGTVVAAIWIFWAFAVLGSFLFGKKRKIQVVNYEE